MNLRMLKAKLHRATVTDADMDYMGSITIDSNLLETVGIREHEVVLVANVTNGKRFETYVLGGEAGSGEIKINGAAAHLATKGDIVLILCFAYVSEADAAELKPHVAILDDRNRIVQNL